MLGRLYSPSVWTLGNNNARLFDQCQTFIDNKQYWRESGPLLIVDLADGYKALTELRIRYEHKSLCLVVVSFY